MARRKTKQASRTSMTARQGFALHAAMLTAISLIAVILNILVFNQSIWSIFVVVASGLAAWMHFMIVLDLEKRAELKLLAPPDSQAHSQSSVPDTAQLDGQQDRKIGDNAADIAAQNASDRTDQQVSSRVQEQEQGQGPEMQSLNASTQSTVSQNDREETNYNFDQPQENNDWETKS